MPVNAELLASLLAPVPGDQPAGRDLRYDAKYEAFREARREDLAIPGEDDPGRKVADWNQALALGTDLCGQTKDLQLAAWMVEVLLRKQGVAGLTTGLAFVQGLLEQYWDGCFPEIEDDDLELRAGPLEWIGAKLIVPVRTVVIASGGISFIDATASREIPTEAAIADAEYDEAKALRARRAEAEQFGKVLPEAVDAAIDGTGKAFYKSLLSEIDGATAALAALERTSDARFGRDAPAFTGLRGVLDELRRFTAATLTRKLEQDPDPVDVTATDDIVAESAAPIEEAGALTPEPASRADAANRIAVVSKWMRQQDSTNPAPYAMLRAFRWGELRATLPDGDLKLLEAPPTPVRTRLKTLLLDGKWAELLEQSEQVMATPAGRGWLDLQRYAMTACANLGSTHDAVAAVMRSELHALLAAWPALPRLTLMDDTPTANDDTREWLAQGEEPASSDAPNTAAEADEAGDVTPDDGADELGDAAAHDPGAVPLGGLTRSARRPTVRPRDAFDLARAELAQGRPHRAIERLGAELASDPSPRARFVRQTQMAYIMVEAGLDAVATPILRQLLEVIDERNLEQWESGALVAQPLALMCRVLDRTGEDDDQRAELYRRICRLDAMQALALQAR